MIYQNGSKRSKRSKIFSRFSAYSILIAGLGTEGFSFLFYLIFQVSGNVEKKICAVGLTKWLCETNCTITGAYSQYWPRLLETLVGFFELPQDDSIPDDEHFIEIEDTPGYQTAYSQLVFAGKNDHDPLAAIPDAKINLAQSLSKLSVGQPGLVRPLVAQSPPKVQEFLNAYLQNANVNLN